MALSRDLSASELIAALPLLNSLNIGALYRFPTNTPTRNIIAVLQEGERLGVKIALAPVLPPGNPFGPGLNIWTVDDYEADIERLYDAIAQENIEAPELYCFYLPPEDAYSRFTSALEDNNATLATNTAFSFYDQNALSLGMQNLADFFSEQLARAPSLTLFFDFLFLEEAVYANPPLTALQKCFGTPLDLISPGIKVSAQYGRGRCESLWGGLDGESQVAFDSYVTYLYTYTLQELFPDGSGFLLGGVEESDDIADFLSDAEAYRGAEGALPRLVVDSLDAALLKDSPSDWLALGLTEPVIPPFEEEPLQLRLLLQASVLQLNIEFSSRF